MFNFSFCSALELIAVSSAMTSTLVADNNETPFSIFTLNVMWDLIGDKGTHRGR